MIDVFESTDHFVHQARAVGARSPQWLVPVREAALARFTALGWPSKRHEDWRFTSLKAITKAQFTAAPEAGQMDVDPYILEQNSIVLVFANGVYRPDLSRLQDTADGIILSPLKDAMEGPHGELVAQHLGAYASSENAAFTALNTALADQGVFLHTAPNTTLEPLLEIIHINEGGEQPFANQARHLLLAGENSYFRVVETHVSSLGTTCFTNSVLEMKLDRGARVEHYLRDNSAPTALHVHTLAAVLKDKSKLESHNLLTGGDLVRNNMRIVFDGEGSEAYVGGLYVGQGKQVLDNHIYMDHAGANNNSNQFFKGILDDRSRGVLTGRVVVRPDAQKTDSHQTNRNLLLSEEARVDTQPQLEIYADDVKCAHGATTGQLDEDALFYFQARGVAPDKARDLLLYAFANEVIERMPLESLRHAAEAFLMERFETGRLLGDPT